ncbi:hypothetical protein JOB18_006091 [Solea senegalensis]|uniref:Uncharacterized protein n=1 Tax=Solea senegalensis TaxID=28829 RepID=A0AAV6QSG7_SOLSE|nr:hypothetical protein JOB18_006091 [Solea senegalensis]
MSKFCNWKFTVGNLKTTSAASVPLPPRDDSAIVIKFAQSCNNSKTLIICFSLCLCRPFRPVANRVDLPVSSPVEFWVAHNSLSSAPAHSQKRIQISLSKIRSSYVKNKNPLHHQNGSRLLERIPIPNLEIHPVRPRCAKGFQRVPETLSSLEEGDSDRALGLSLDSFVQLRFSASPVCLIGLDKAGVCHTENFS